LGHSFDTSDLEPVGRLGRDHTGWVFERPALDLGKIEVLCSNAVRVTSAATLDALRHGDHEIGLASGRGALSDSAGVEHPAILPDAERADQFYPLFKGHRSAEGGGRIDHDGIVVELDDPNAPHQVRAGLIRRITPDGDLKRAIAVLDPLEV
jgi:hypothetical protein